MTSKYHHNVFISQIFSGNSTPLLQKLSLKSLSETEISNQDLLRHPKRVTIPVLFKTSFKYRFHPLAPLLPNPLAPPPLPHPSCPHSLAPFHNPFPQQFALGPLTFLNFNISTIWVRDPWVSIQINFWVTLPPTKEVPHTCKIVNYF